MDVSVVFPKGNMLKKILDSVKELVLDATMVFTQSGLSMACMDSSHIALICIDMPASEFHAFTCGKDMEVSFSVPTLLKLMTFATNNSFVQVDLVKGGDLMSVKFSENNEGGAPDAEFQMPLMDIDREGLNVPEMTYDGQCLADAEELKAKLMGCKEMCDNIILRMSREVVELSPDSEVKSIIRYKTGKIEMVEGVEDVACTFSIKYILHFMKGAALSKEMILSLDANKPAKFQFKIGKQGRLTFLLAPKLVDNEEEESAKRARIEN